MNIIGGLGYNLGFLYDDLKIKEFPRDLNVFKIFLTKNNIIRNGVGNNKTTYSSTSQTNHHIITNCEILLPEKIGASQEE